MYDICDFSSVQETHIEECTNLLTSFCRRINTREFVHEVQLRSMLQIFLRIQMRIMTKLMTTASCLCDIDLSIKNVIYDMDISVFAKAVNEDVC